MRKIKEVLRLRFELRLGQREIARACSISQGAVHNYLRRAAAAGIAWPTPEGWDEQRVEQTLFGERQVVKRLPEAQTNCTWSSSRSRWTPNTAGVLHLLLLQTAREDRS